MQLASTAHAPRPHLGPARAAARRSGSPHRSGTPAQRSAGTDPRGGSGSQRRAEGRPSAPVCPHAPARARAHHLREGVGDRQREVVGQQVDGAAHGAVVRAAGDAQWLAVAVVAHLRPSRHGASGKGAHQAFQLCRATKQQYALQPRRHCPAHVPPATLAWTGAVRVRALRRAVSSAAVAACTFITPPPPPPPAPGPNPK